MDSRDLVAVIFAITICLILLGSVGVSLFYPPGTVTETFRIKTFEIMTYILGVVSGWLLAKGTK